MCPNVNEALVFYTLTGMKSFHFAQIWLELLPFPESWFSVLKFAQIFPIYGNVSNFTQTWMKLFCFAKIWLRLLKFTQMLIILSILD